MLPVLHGHCPIQSHSLSLTPSFMQTESIKELTEPQISEGTWRKERRASYSREFKVRLAKQALQPGAIVARIAREHDINYNLLFKWKNQYEDGLLSDDDNRNACLSRWH